MGAEETPASRSRQILRDPECFKEVRGYISRFDEMLYFYYVYQLERIQVARFEQILYKRN